MELLLTEKTEATTNSETDSETVQDCILVQRIVLGDESAFVEIMNLYYGKILGFAQKLLRNAADAEDVAQDTFIRAYRGISSFRGEASLSTWLHRIALNVTRNRYWYFFRRRRHDSLSLDFRMGERATSTLADFITSGGPDPAQDAITSEFTGLVAECMEQLDTPHREILILRIVRGLPYEEIAQTLGLGMGTVKSRIGRARESLRQILKDRAPDLSYTPMPSGHSATRLAFSEKGFFAEGSER